MKKILNILCMLLVSTCFLAASQANALLVDVSGGLSALGASPQIVSPPPPNVLDDTAFNLGMQGFNERQGVYLASDLAVDGGFVPAGTFVDSHMIFLDEGEDAFHAVGYNEHLNVKWTFDGLILGVMSDFLGTEEAASSSFLGAPGTVYPGAFIGRGLETDPFYAQPDGYVISGNELTVSMAVLEPGDWIRVVTQTSVPEPSTVLLLGSGLVGFGFARRMFKA